MRTPRMCGRAVRGGLRCAAAVAAVASTLVAVAPAMAHDYDDDAYLRFADGLVTQLEPNWSPSDGYYRSGSPALDSRVNAAMLLVFATAATRGHVGPSRNDARARQLARALTASPPFVTDTTAPWPDPMFHTPGWVGNLVAGYSVMDKAIDPKIAEGLSAAWQARDAIALPIETRAAIADEISRVAHGPFFRFPNVRLNQINWPLELDGYDALVTGDGTLLRDEYRLQMARFVAGIRRPWLKPFSSSTTNLSPSYRFHYLPDRPESRATNLDSAEYANMTLHFLAFYDEARRAGMPEPPAADVRLLRAWVQRTLFGYWTHAGLLNWDTGLGLRRWMKAKTWAYAQQGLLAIVSAARFRRDPRYRAWAKSIFDHGLDAYDRMGGAAGLAASTLYGVPARAKAADDTVLLAARMAANAARAVAAGLGRRRGAEPPPFYAFDADIGRLAVSTPAYSTAVIAVNRGAFPYGGIELARLFDGQGQPLSGIGGRSQAAFGVVIRDRAGRVELASQQGLQRDPARPPLVLTNSPQGAVRRLRRLPARPAAGPFDVLEAVGRRRSARFEITTRHRFTATAIDEAWTVRRRRGHGFYSVLLQLPSWNAGAAADAVLADGRRVPITLNAPPLALGEVRAFELRGTASGYRVVLGRPVGGTVRAIPTVAEAWNPDPGPTLELTLAAGTRFKRTGLRARIIPALGH